MVKKIKFKILRKLMIYILNFYDSLKKMLKCQTFKKKKQREKETKFAFIKFCGKKPEYRAFNGENNLQ